MKKNLPSKSGISNPRVLLAFSLCSVGILLAMLSFGATPTKQNVTAEKPTAIKAQAAHPVGAPTTPVQGVQCTAPYVEIDGPGSGTDPTMGELTIESVNVGEPFTTCSDQSITFTMHVQTMDPAGTGMATPPPNAEWLISFQIIDDSANPETVFVSMDTKAPGATPASPEFSWGTGGSAVCTASTSSSCPTISGSVTRQGLITIKLTATTLSFSTFTWTPKKGTVLTSMTGTTSLVQTIQTDGPVPGGNGSYTMQGNFSCSAPPIAALSANPTSGSPPLTVNFDASGSKIPAGGCGTINSYTFDFGDGTGVTQATPTVSHAYASAGNYTASLSVTNTVGLASNNIARQSIMVSWLLAASPNVGVVNNLYGVTCASTSECWAAGYYISGGLYRTLIEQWDGTAWSIVNSPNNNDGSPNILSGVTCASTSECWAVGASYPSGIPQTLIEQWEGTAWSIVTSPNNGTSNNQLNGVTCTSASQCFAVGYYNNGSDIPQTLVEQWDGTAWSIVTSPNNGAAGGNQLNGVACASASECWAVGASFNANSIPRTLIEQWDGTAWSIVTSPNNSTSGGNQLNGVTCTSASQCLAVGYYNNNGSNIPQTLIEQWNGTAWSIVTSPNNGTSGNQLNGVTCTSASRCFGVGNYNTGSFIPQTLIEQWDGTVWSIVNSPNNGTSNNQLNGVACASAFECWAVGYYISSSGPFQTLIEESMVPPPPVQLNTVVSRMTHGSAGPFDIDLPLTGTRGVECRSSASLGAGNYTLVFNFASPLTSVGSVSASATGTIQPGPTTGSIDSSDAHNYIVNLTGVPNAQYITITLTNVTDSAREFSSAVSATMGVLIGDVNADGGVSNLDVSLVKAKVAAGAMVDSSNFRDDVNADGGFSNLDVSITKAQVAAGAQLPTPP